MYLITGVSGVGKTAVIPHLKQSLGDKFEVHDFDERGVPDNADSQWRVDETEYWIEYGRKKDEGGVTVVVCGFSNPDEIAEIQGKSSDVKVQTILLDADAKIIENRLRNRNTDESVKKDLERAVGSVETFIKNNTRFIPILRKICREHQCPVVDTTHMAPEAVADDVAKLIKQSGIGTVLE
ncbi:MAG: hypothetical protein COV70_02800 [Parcubacteria group bacterium CG11_big_fil_rev_8_21_14_0_20_39_22]|nr:MAG: hypothetical protein COV70_02800 [Parcubacteria group bacterium CG11_big_fil_rev_8_21_14_0_20_39_22]